jgi:hypothetical protein
MERPDLETRALSAASMERPDLATRALRLESVAFLALTAFYVVHRVEMLDEGWYLYAGKLAWRGEVPYRDFAYFQAPLLPYLYGATQKLFGPGILSGRLLAAAFAAGSWLFTLSTARRLGGSRAAVLAGLAFLASVYLYSHFPIVLTYAPAAFFLMAAVDSFLRGGVFRTVLFAILAAGIRVSLAPAVPILAAGVFLASSRSRVEVARLAGALGAGAALLLAFVLPDPGLAWFSLVGYHTEGWTSLERLRAVGASAAETLATTSILIVPALVAPRLAPARPVSYLAATAAAVLLANLLPATTAPYYDSVLLPLLAVLAGLSLARLRRPVLVAALLALHLAAQLEPARRLHVVGLARPRAGWPFEDRLARVRDVGRDLRAVTTPSSKIFTLATYFAIEADRDVMPGLSMSIFSVEFYGTRAQCLRHHTVNPAMIREWFAEAVPDVVVLTNWEVQYFGGRDGPILAPLREHYTIRKMYGRVGQFDGKAFLLTRRAGKAE